MAQQSLPAALDQLRVAIAALDSDDAAKARSDLLETFEKLEEELQDGDLSKAETKARELARELDKFVRDEEIAPDEAATIADALDAVETALADSRAALAPGRSDEED